MSRRTPLGHADNRPRVYVWMAAAGAFWALSPTGPRTSSLSIPEAIAAALDAVEHRSAIIIFEGRS